jgi:hypothetical protein
LQISLSRYGERPLRKVFELIAKLSIEVGQNEAIDEDWIRMIPHLIQILSLLLSPQDDRLGIEVSSLIHQIALKITDPSHLNLLPDSNDSNHNDDDHQSRQPCLDDTLGRAPDSLVTYFKITLGPMRPGPSSAPTPTPRQIKMGEHGLGVARHLQRIRPSFLSTEALEWSRSLLSEG